jgi:hypothetical protein
VIVAVGRHVGRDGDEQLGSCDRERARRLWELDVEADERRNDPARERNEPQVDPGAEDRALGAEQPRLSVDGGDRSPLVDAGRAVREPTGGQALGEADDRRRAGTGRGGGDLRELRAVGDKGRRVERLEVVRAQKQLGEEREGDAPVLLEHAHGARDVRPRVAGHRRELRKERLHESILALRLRQTARIG